MIQRRNAKRKYLFVVAPISVDVTKEVVALIGTGESRLIKGLIEDKKYLMVVFRRIS